MTYSSKQVATDHKDLIHDVSYDFYGRRMATCSSDQNVKVGVQSQHRHSQKARFLSYLLTLQVLDLKDGEWHCTATWRVSLCM